MIKYLYETACFAREKMEHGSDDPDLEKLLVELYSAYNPAVGDVSLFVRTGLRQFPHLCCGLASLYLKELIGTGEVVGVRYGLENHTVYKPLKRTMMDIAADQYDGPEIYVGPMVEPWSPKL